MLKRELELILERLGELMDAVEGLTAAVAANTTATAAATAAIAAETNTPAIEAATGQIEANTAALNAAVTPGPQGTQAATGAQGTTEPVAGALEPNGAPPATGKDLVGA